MKYPYEIGARVKLGRRSFDILGYESTGGGTFYENTLKERLALGFPTGIYYNERKLKKVPVKISPKLSRPYLDGIIQKSGYATIEEKMLIMKGFAEVERKER